MSPAHNGHMKMYDTPHTGLVLLGALLGPDLLDPVLVVVVLLLVVLEDRVGEPVLDHESAEQGLVSPYPVLVLLVLGDRVGKPGLNHNSSEQGLVSPDPVLVLLGALLGPDLLDPVLVEVGLLLVVPED